MNKSESNRVTFKKDNVGKHDSGEYVCFGYPNELSNLFVKKTIKVEVVNENENLNLSKSIKWSASNRKRAKRSIYEEEYDENSGDVLVNFKEEHELEGVFFRFYYFRLI